MDDEKDIIMICERHKTEPVTIYHSCVGCELESLQQANLRLKLSGKYRFTNVASQSEIANALDQLAVDIEDIATVMDYFGGFAAWAKHAREMVGAAGICREWATEIRNEVKP